ncbi:MAG TPA: ferritin-like domain-containing protein [Alphaproteobacteria bacterium]|nr:ferritin-like domain-containing protein [Alphaproteobacteria bacterium]
MTSVTTQIKEMFTGDSELKTLHDNFVEMLRDIYDAEHQVLEALPHMAENSQNSELKAAFRKHETQTKGQIERLEQVFDSIGEEPERKTCQAAKGLIEEGQEVIDTAAEPARDAGLLAAGQAFEHYEMARYGTLAAWAREMGHKEAARLLEQTLAEEEQTDELLTKLADKSVNRTAAEGLGEAHAAMIASQRKTATHKGNRSHKH